MKLALRLFSYLSLKTKFLVIFLIDGAIITICAFLFFNYFVMKSLDDVEDVYLENEASSIETLLHKKTDTLLSNAKDYANWDDMYDYVDKRNENWAKQNITDRIPKNFGVDLILVFNAKGDLIYRYGDFEEFAPDKDLASLSLLKEAIKVKENKGLYLTSKGIALVASSQIMHTDESGPRNGTYIYAQLITQKILEEMKQVIGVGLSIISEKGIVNSTLTEDIQRPKEFKDIYGQLAAENTKGPERHFYKPNYQNAFGYSLLKDIKGKGIGVLEIIRPRKSIAAVKILLIKIAILTLILVSLSVLITVLIITKSILKPLDTLRQSVEEIKKTKDMLKRVKIDSGDEVGDLAVHFNLMMEALNKSQSALIESDEKYRGLYESVKDAIIRVNMEGIIEQCNQACLDMLGYTQEELTKLSYQQLTPQKWQEMEADIVKNQIMLRGYSKEYEKEYIRKNGEVLPISIRVWLIKDKKEVPIGMWGVVRDITERKHAEEELRKAYDKLVKTQTQLLEATKMTTAAELAMGTVHQINNPLSIVIGRIQLLQRLSTYKTKIPESDLERDLKIIEEQTRRAVDITNNLLSYANPLTLRFEKCDINKLLEDTLGLIKPQLETEKVEVIKNLKTDLPRIEYCDPQQMKDVFMNIINNAQQAMPGGGRLEISTHYAEKEDTVYIKFKDNGCGIPPENIKNLFTPFFTTKADRTGLGLAMSLNIVKGHRGSIEVESEVGKGATFIIKIPAGTNLKV